MLKLTAIGLAVPLFMPGCMTSKQPARSPSSTLQLGSIGTGRMGRGDIMACLKQGLKPEANSRIIAVCDVNADRAALAKTMIDEFYEKNLPTGSRPVVAVYRDYRDLLSRKDIDGVTISTPDHWHAFNAIDAANAGKDIYVQKPLTYSIEEGKGLVSAVRKNRIVLQTGSQQRSDARFRNACELVRNGRLGTLRNIHVTLPADKGTGDATQMPVPEELDYDLWLGPAPDAPYTEHRVQPQKGFGRPGFLQIERYCLGMITGWGSHMFDIAQWGHGSDESGPVEMKATAEFPDRGLFDVHTEFEAEGRYADGVTLTAKTGAPGVKFTGDDGWLFVTRGRWEASDPSLLEGPMGEGKVKLYVSEDHMLDFLTSMRSRQDPACPVEVGHRSNSICVITHISMKLGRKLKWNPKTERFIGDPEANRMLSATYRKPWKIA